MKNIMYFLGSLLIAIAAAFTFRLGGTKVRIFVSEINVFVNCYRVKPGKVKYAVSIHRFSKIKRMGKKSYDVDGTNKKDDRGELHNPMIQLVV